MSRTISMTGLP